MLKILKQNELSNNINNINNIEYTIQEKVAAQIIQKYAIKYFNNYLGDNWKTILNYKWTTEELDYYCYRKNIMDPFHDYL
jgi:hypothetical protein